MSGIPTRKHLATTDFCLEVFDAKNDFLENEDDDQRSQLVAVADDAFDRDAFIFSQEPEQREGGQDEAQEAPYAEPELAQASGKVRHPHVQT